MKSFKFHLILLLIKLKGIRRLYSNDSLDYKKLRQSDIHKPELATIYGLKHSSIPILKSSVTEIIPPLVTSRFVILYCPGGSFVSGPAKFNWSSIASIAIESGAISYLIDYPKSPEVKIDEINSNIDAVYEYLLTKYDTSNIICMGGSVGGTLMALLVQRLIMNQKNIPGKLILITPMLDCSMTNTEIDFIEAKDILYAKKGILAANRMSIDNLNLKSEAYSPLYGTINNFPQTLFFIAENDMQRPDAELFCEKLRNEGRKVTVEYGKGMPHIWPLLPIMLEAKTARKKIVEFIL